jgi:DNA replication protein DnaC
LLASGDVGLKTGANLVLFGPTRLRQESSLGAARARPRRERLTCAFHAPTDLVQRLQVAQRQLAPEAATAKLDRYDLLILDDIAYVTKDQAETSVLFSLSAARYERRSLFITAN